PTVVLSFLDDVDLVAAAWPIETARTVLGLKHQVAVWLEVETLRVAMAERPDFGPRVLLADKRIVLWDSAVVVESQRLAGDRIHFLRDLAISCVSGCDVKLAVGTETKPAAGVKLCGGNFLDDHFSIDEAFRRFPIPHHTHARAAAAVT